MSQQSILNCRVIGNFESPPLTSRLVTCRGLQLAGRGEVRVEQDVSGWPDRTDILCWHCAHPFQTPPVPRPVSYDDRRAVWRVQGNYCCFGCAAAACSSGLQTGLLSSLFRRIYGPQDSFSPVPPKCLLKAFGGVMTIEEFRSNQQHCRVIPARLISSEEAVHVECEPQRKTRTPALLDYSDVTSSNEVFRLKRDKPLMAGRGLLPAHARLVR